MMDSVIEAVRELCPEDVIPSNEQTARQRSLLVAAMEAEATIEQHVASDEIGDDPNPQQDRRLRASSRIRRTRRAARYVAMSVTATAVAVVVVLLPSTGPSPSVPAVVQPKAAQELSLISTRAAARSTAHSIPELLPGQWLSTQSQVVLSVQNVRIGSTRTPDAKTTIHALVSEWANEQGQSCVSGVMQPAQFASPADQAAWNATGIRSVPTTNPVTGCSTVAGATPLNGEGLGIGAIDAARLPRDPATLAKELSTGTTGMLGLDDDKSTRPGDNGGFERAVDLLVGPTTGVTPQFTAALYRALSLMPGIRDVGRVTTSQGKTGVGFVANWIFGPSEIIVDPSTGVLLEARNILFSSAFSVLENGYVGTPSPSGGEVQVTVALFDPTTSPSVVTSDSIPFPVNFDN
jgi:hypothetical protein